MKQIAFVLTAALVLAALASLAACSGGTFHDPGHFDAGAGGGGNGTGGGGTGGGGTGGGGTGGGGTGGGGSGGTGGGGNKPAKLSTSASYDEAVAKMVEIIDYCEANPGTMNQAVKGSVLQLQQYNTGDLIKNGWTTKPVGKSETTGEELIKGINVQIDRLE